MLSIIDSIFIDWTKCSCKDEGNTASLFFRYKDLKENTFKEIKDANKLYFKSLANTRASVSMLVIAWTGLLILAIEIIAFYYYFNIGLEINPFSNIFFNLLVFIACYLVIAFFLPFLGSFVYKRQILSTAFLALCYASIFFTVDDAFNCSYFDINKRIYDRVSQVLTIFCATIYCRNSSKFYLSLSLVKKAA